MTKPNDPDSKCKYSITPASICEQLSQSAAEGRLILYCDEVCFTKHTNQGTDWSRLHMNISVDQKAAFDAFKAVIASISTEHGVAYCEIHDWAVTKVEFADYLRALRKKFGQRPLCVFIDNLQSHRSPEVKVLAEELDIRLVYNKSHSFQYQPIEMVFSEVKAWYKKIKLNHLARGLEFDKERAIKQAFDRVPLQHVKN